jgi:Uma2 family endonuclease
MVTREKLYTAQEFWKITRLPENELRRLELEDGVIVDMPSSSPLNTIISGRIATFMNNYVMQENLGYVTVPDGGFKLTEDHVRQPDVAFISKQRQPKIPKHFEIAPDIAVEVVSTNEDVLKKVDEYLEAGTKLVWVIYPHEKTAHVFRKKEPRWQKLGVNETLSGEDALVGFELPVKDIFPPDSDT